jgi:hypothetical protein
VCKIQNTHHAEDQRQSRTEHEEQQTIAQTVEHGDDEKLHKSTFRFPPYFKKKGPILRDAGPTGALKTLAWALHLAAGRRARNIGRELFDRQQGHARIFYTVVVLLVGFAPDGQIQRLLKLVIRFTHLNFTIENAFAGDAF